ncbi:MAG: hypothetical protein IPK10_15485 [Bacteroidetes bacterium]|nr:hypothetical protein [Bacteroidota bacterium]
MKITLLRIVCIFALAIGTSTVSKAQLVHIPDSAFRVYLNQNFGILLIPIVQQFWQQPILL